MIRRFKFESAALVAMAVLALQLATPTVQGWLQRPSVGSMGVERLSGPAMASIWPEYLLYLPEDYASADQSNRMFPLVLYLHGSGDRGKGLSKVRERGLPKHLWMGGQYPTVVAAPQCRDGQIWCPGELIVVLDQLSERHQVDPSRVTVVGESMGGYGAWALAAYAPDRLAAAVPICGGGDVATAHRLVGLPVWAFHGDSDSVVPIEESEEMVSAVRAHGGDARLTMLQGSGHNLLSVPLRRDVQDWIVGQCLVHAVGQEGHGKLGIDDRVSTTPLGTPGTSEVQDRILQR